MSFLLHATLSRLFTLMEMIYSIILKFLNCSHLKLSSRLTQKGRCVTFWEYNFPRQCLNWNWNILSKTLPLSLPFLKVEGKIFNFSLSRHVKKTVNEVIFIKKLNCHSLELFSTTHGNLMPSECYLWVWDKLNLMGVGF